MRPGFLRAIFIHTHPDELLPVYHNHVHPNCAPGVRLYHQESERVLPETEDSEIVKERLYQVNGVKLPFYHSDNKRRRHFICIHIYET